ncbi:hypothetical protein H5410_022161 [Solanum commersonii]|uniref:Uncharacterized protein n=1 Tax=Solanum commersonii TaxID=4109 RepID=A0A9J5ZGC5_SOLCO|nr:hypothetical protein H5410_022161 [Solanum commersonii]
MLQKGLSLVVVCKKELDIHVGRIIVKRVRTKCYKRSWVITLSISFRGSRRLICLDGCFLKGVCKEVVGGSLHIWKQPNVAYYLRILHFNYYIYVMLLFENWKLLFKRYFYLLNTENVQDMFLQIGVKTRNE